MDQADKHTVLTFCLVPKSNGGGKVPHRICRRWNSRSFHGISSVLIRVRHQKLAAFDAKSYRLCWIGYNNLKWTGLGTFAVETFRIYDSRISTKCATAKRHSSEMALNFTCVGKQRSADCLFTNVEQSCC